LRRTCDSLAAYGIRTVAVPVDLADATERQRLTKRVLDELGRIDVLVNNAAIENEGAFVQTSWPTVDQTIEVNLTAPIHLTHLLLPHMLRQRNGHVIHISSIAGKLGVPYDAVYSGTKAALGEWSRAVRLELAHTGIHVSTIFPGYIVGVGMFARFDMLPPWLVGSSTAAHVAAAVVQTIEEPRPEVIVNSRPIRAVFALAQLFPRLADWIIGRSGIAEFQRKKVGA
jgi:short-subunit dehydrogenase